jgi:hypothetical protein
MNINALRDVDNDPGFYAAASSAADNWGGAVLFQSIDDGVTYQAIANFSARATMGYTLDALGDYAGGNTVDELNTIRVSLNVGALSSVTYAAMLEGAQAALIGDEVLYFRDAVLGSDGIYRLRGFLRGRRGTEAQIGAHHIGDRFVLLTPLTLKRIAQVTADIGKTRLYKVVTVGASLADSPAHSFTNDGAALKPYAPVHIGGGRDADGNLTITWTRRTRISGEWRDNIDVPLGEESEAYDVEIVDATFTTVKRTFSALNSPTVTYSAANQVHDGYADGDPVFVRVYQISAIVGRGYPGTAAIGFVGSEGGPGMLTGFAMNGSQEVSFISRMFGPVVDGYFAADLASPSGATLVGISDGIAPGMAIGRGFVLGASFDGQIAINGTPRAITTTELLTFLNSIKDYRYHEPVTTAPSIVTGVPGFGPETKGGVALIQTFSVDSNYITTTGRVLNWNSVTPPPSQWGPMAWSPTLGILVVLAQLGGELGGDLMTSTDGETWTSRFVDDNRWKTALIWSEQASKFIYYSMPTLPGGSMFMGIHVPYNTMWSDDGITWHEQVGAPDVNWAAVVPVPSEGITVGIGVHEGKTKSGLSTDGGLTWTLTELPLISTPQVVNLSMAWSPEQSQFVAVFHSTDGAGAITSPDGINWTKRHTPVGFWHSISWNPGIGLYIAGGASYPVTDTVVQHVYAWSMMSSPDGVTWTPVSNIFFPLWLGAPYWMEEQGRYVVHGSITNSDGLGSAPVMVTLSSEDGLNWDQMQPGQRGGLYIPELGRYVGIDGYTDGTTALETTFYWPYDHWNITYALP